MPEAVEVVAESEKEGWSDLPDKVASRSAGREFAFHHREDGFVVRTLSAENCDTSVRTAFLAERLGVVAQE
jgi:hypothetical protein